MRTYYQTACLMVVMWISCATPSDPCACPETPAERIACAPVEVDTVVLIDKNDLTKEWYATSFYTLSDDFDSLSVRKYGDVTLRCGWRDQRLLLMDMRVRIADPEGE
ncbi:MAG: hypothetical protein R3301_06910 [Saprospiraceae bacterium]|nr:hypothetical protein [Saprospiraceae bacterium]